MGDPATRAARLSEPGRPGVRIVSGPISLLVLAGWGLVLFAAAIFHGHQLSVLDRAASSVGFPVPATQSREAQPSVAPSPGATAVPSPATTQPAISSVTMRMMKYSPATLEVARGATVEWKNDDLTPHTATSTAKQFDSGPINPGASWRHTFTEEGEFAYLCTFHPEMKGVIIVR